MFTGSFTAADIAPMAGRGFDDLIRLFQVLRCQQCAALCAVLHCRTAALLRCAVRCAVH